MLLISARIHCLLLNYSSVFETLILPEGIFVKPPEDNFPADFTPQIYRRTALYFLHENPCSLCLRHRVILQSVYFYMDRALSGLRQCPSLVIFRLFSLHVIPFQPPVFDTLESSIHPEHRRHEKFENIFIIVLVDRHPDSLRTQSICYLFLANFPMPTNYYHNGIPHCISNNASIVFVRCDTIG